MDNGKKSIWTFADRLQGDKVVWIIALMFMLFSIVCSFSSTSRLLKENTTRVDMVWSQIKIVAAGLAVIIICYNIKNIRLFRWFSRWGFIVSAILLTILATHKDFGFVKAARLNDAWRVLAVGKIQIHVFEIVKVAMVLYLAWALDAFKKGSLKLGNTELQKKLIYLFGPFVFVFITVLMGSSSSALLIGGIMCLEILLGSGSYKEMGILILTGIAIIGIAYGVNRISGGSVFERIGTGVNRVFEKENWADSLSNAKFGSYEYYTALDEVRQQESAKIAIKDGGIIGKGPGQSTQRYVVPDVSEDYMYSFIIEEYGLVGGILIIILFGSLLARGAIISRNLGTDLYAKLVVTGLCLTICLQAFLHMCVNAGIGPMTGQTLPMISHGNGAFLCFSLAFGIILSFSRVARLRIQKEAEKAEEERRLAEEAEEERRLADQYIEEEEQEY